MRVRTIPRTNAISRDRPKATTEVNSEAWRNAESIADRPVRVVLSSSA